MPTQSNNGREIVIRKNSDVMKMHLSFLLDKKFNYTHKPSNKHKVSHVYLCLCNNKSSVISRHLSIEPPTQKCSALNLLGGFT